MKNLITFEQYKYQTIDENIYDFFKNLNIDVNIIHNDKQTIIIETKQDVKNSKWIKELKQLLEEFDYDNIYINKYKILITKSLGILYTPDSYNSFD